MPIIEEFIEIQRKQVLVYRSFEFLLFLQKNDILCIEDQQEKRKKIPQIPPAVLLQRSLWAVCPKNIITTEFVQIKISLQNNYIALLLKQVCELCCFLAPFHQSSRPAPHHTLRGAHHGAFWLHLWESSPSVSNTIIHLGFFILTMTRQRSQC